MTVTPLDIVLVILPAVVGYGSQRLCSVGKNAGSSVLFRPPAWAFGIIWPILFLLFGLSWALAARESPTCIDVSHVWANDCPSRCVDNRIRLCKKQKNSCLGSPPRSSCGSGILWSGYWSVKSYDCTPGRMGYIRTANEHDRGTGKICYLTVKRSGDDYHVSNLINLIKF